MNHNSKFNLRLIFLPPGYCNYHCTFCHHEGYSVDRKAYRMSHLDPEKFRDLVLWLQTLGLYGITISGGEPLMQTELVISLLRELPPLPIKVNTNGRWLSKLIPHISVLKQFSWRVYVNIPSVDQILFHQLTGQSKTKPSDILSQVPDLLNTGSAVYLNCVICPGMNDMPELLNSYMNTALQYKVSGVRFVLQPKTPISQEDYLRNVLKIPKENSVSRGGRTKSYELPYGINMKLVRCEDNPTENIDSGRADIFITTKQTVKLGLWREEMYFKDFNHLQTVILRYFP